MDSIGRRGSKQQRREEMDEIMLGLLIPMRACVRVGVCVFV